METVEQVRHAFPESCTYHGFVLTALSHITYVLYWSGTCSSGYRFLSVAIPHISRVLY